MSCRSGRRTPLLYGPWPNNKYIHRSPFGAVFFLLGASSVSFPAREGFGGVRVGDRLFREHESEAIGCCWSCVAMNMLAGVDSVSPCVFRLHQYSSNLFTILPSSHRVLDLIKETSTCVHQKIESEYVRWKKRGV